MAPQRKNPVGTCPACGREGEPLCSCKHLEGDVRVCVRCVKAASRAANPRRKKGPELQTVKDALEGMCERMAAAMDSPSKIARGGRGKETFRAAADAGRKLLGYQPRGDVSASARAVVLRVTCHRIEHVRRVMAAADESGAHVELDGAP